MKKISRAAIFLSLFVAALSAFAQMRESVDLDAIYQIKREGLQNSQVMETMSYLTDIHGPRLTNSPGMRRAAKWAEGKLREWGLRNVRREKWGPFGLGWSNERFVAHVVSPQKYPLIGAPYAWTPGTKGVVKGEALLALIEDEEDLEEYKGKLKGKVVLISNLRELEPPFDPAARRWTEEELAERAVQPFPRRRGARSPRARFRQIREFRRKRDKFFEQEGVLAVVTMSPRDHGILLVGGAGSRQPGEPRGPTRLVLAAEHYGRIVRTLQKEMTVEIELDIKSTFHDQDLDSFNILAEIPGSDKAGEVVMLGAHFDSWHSGTGATDNGAGSGVMMEAIRILKATGLPMRRTVRLGLWTGEEQGLLGSRAYVKEHFADSKDKKWDMKPEHEKFSVYFNVDNGGGKIRGIYLQGNEAAAPVLRVWMRAFRNMGMTTQAIRNTGGTDHLAFNEAGLPGFQFIQDPMDYSTRSHHSNMDTYERLQEDDLKQIAVIVATFVYHAANRDELFPRKPMPEPPRPRGGGR